MWKAFSKLALANAKHYDEHKNAHNAMTAVAGAFAAASFIVMGKALSED